MTTPILKGSQSEQAARDAERKEQAAKLERLRWWQLAEAYRRCVQIARDEWDDVLDAAQVRQHTLAVEMRDRVREGTRATGAKFAADVGIPVPLFTPRDRMQFVKEVAATLLISADRQNLPVTPEGKRAAQKADATDGGEAGSGVDETDSNDEARRLADAGEAPHVEAGGLAVSAAPAP